MFSVVFRVGFFFGQALFYFWPAIVFLANQFLADHCFIFGQPFFGGEPVFGRPLFYLWPAVFFGGVPVVGQPLFYLWLFSSLFHLSQFLNFLIY